MAKLEIVLKKEIEVLDKDMQKIEIKNDTDMKEAAELLTNFNKKLDAITEEKEKVTKPLNDALTAERARWKPFETKLSGYITTIRKAMGSYQLQKEKEAEEEAARIAARVGEGKGKLKIETAVRKMDEIEKPATVVGTTEGMVKFREIKKLKITDASKIPAKFLVPNEAMILEALKNGETVPGCEIEIEKSVVNFR